MLSSSLPLVDEDNYTTFKPAFKLLFHLYVDDCVLDTRTNLQKRTDQGQGRTMPEDEATSQHPCQGMMM